MTLHTYTPLPMSLPSINFLHHMVSEIFFFFFSLEYILFTLFSQSIFHRSREGEGSQPPIGSFVFGITYIDKTVGKTT